MEDHKILPVIFLIIYFVRTLELLLQGRFVWMVFTYISIAILGYITGILLDKEPTVNQCLLWLPTVLKNLTRN